MITCNKLLVGYNRKPVTPLINLNLLPGSMTALTGINGIGKSTLLKTLAGLILPVSGEYKIKLSQNNIGWLSQHSELELRMPITVFELVAMGCWPYCGWFRKINKSLYSKIEYALHTVNMLSLANNSPQTLSGGQLQRALFARILIQKSKLWLLDEPFSGIDIQTISLLMSILQKQNKNGTTILVVLHDHQLLNRYFKNIIFMNNKEIKNIVYY